MKMTISDKLHSLSNTLVAIAYDNANNGDSDITLKYEVLMDLIRVTKEIKNESLEMELKNGR